MTTYTLGNVARICRISPARLRYWKRTELLEADTSRPAFEFRDLVSVRAVVGLIERGVPLRRIRKTVEDVRHRMPEVDRPLGALREWLDGSGRVVLRVDGALLEPSGQTVFDFAQGRPPDEAVALLAAHRRSVAQGMALAREVALEWFEQGCRLDTDRATWDEAIEAYHRALDADPEFADAHCNLGSVYFNQDRKATARACFERALELEPGHVEANLNLAALLEEDGRNETALRHYKIALVADPLCADTHVSLALLYERLGLRRSARDHWRRYLQLDPGGAWADLARNRLRGR